MTIAEFAELGFTLECFVEFVDVCVSLATMHNDLLV